MRIRIALLLAVVAHGVVVAAIVSAPGPSTARAVVVGSAESESVIDVEGPVAAVESAATGPAARAVAAGLRGFDRVGVRAASRGAALEEVVAAPNASWTFGPAVVATSPDLGIGTRWRSVVAAPERPAVERSMRETLAADDVEKGLGRGGALVTAVHEAASSPMAPDVGVVTFEVACDASGAVVEARADNAAWDEVAKGIVRVMKGRSIRATPRGLRVSLRAVAERVLPSGSHGTSSLGAVPDDAPGSASVCEGKGITRRCMAGLPVGFTNAAKDASNIGEQSARIVRVQVLAEK